MILALLLLAAVTASTIGTAVTISTTTSQSKNIDNFILASIAGDSGIERNLAIIRYFRATGKKITDTDGTVGNDLESSLVSANTGSQSLGSGAQFSGSTRLASDPILVSLLKSNEKTSLDVFEFDASGLLKKTTAQYLYVKAGGGTTGDIEVSWVMIDPTGDSSCTGRNFFRASDIVAGLAQFLLDKTTNQQGGSCTELNPMGFRVGLRALNGSITNLTAEAFPCNIVANSTCGSPAGIPSRIQIDITGQAGSARALKTASVLWQLPSSGLFNYVLFTEGDIVPN